MESDVNENHGDRLRTKFSETLEKRLYEEDWFKNSDLCIEITQNNRLRLRKDSWYPTSFDSKIYFEVNPINPRGRSTTISIKIGHEYVTRKNNGFMSIENHNFMIKKIQENMPPGFKKSSYSGQYIRCNIEKELKPENYTYILDQVLEKLQELHENCTEIIDSNFLCFPFP